MPRALVIGSDGFLGGHLIRRLRAMDGWSVTGVGKAAGDLSESGVADAALASAPPVDVVFHAVTRQRTGQVQYALQGELLRANSLIHLNVLDAWRLRQPQAKLVSMGSSCTYPDAREPLKETLFGASGIHPSVRGYAQAKMLLAIGAQVYAEQYGLKHLHCVLATLYGPNDHKAPDRSHFVGAMLHRAAQAKRAGAREFPVWGDPATVREVLHVDDQIDAILAATSAFENRVLNCAAGAPVTVGEVARASVAAVGLDVPLTGESGSFQGAAFKLLDSSDFLTKTGWRPRIGLEEGLHRLALAEYADVAR